MKKLIVILTLMFLVQGCSISDKRNYSKKVEQYESYYQTVLDSDKFSSKSPYFSIQAEMDKVAGGYVYEIIVDEAKVAMYDVKIMVVEDRKDFDAEEKMMPSAGVFDDKVYNVLPNQVRVDKGYMNGFQLLGEIPSDSINLEILVIFNDYRKLNTYREFFEFDLEYEDPKTKDEDKETDEETEDKEKDEETEDEETDEETTEEETNDDE